MGFQDIDIDLGISVLTVACDIHGQRSAGKRKYKSDMEGRFDIPPKQNNQFQRTVLFNNHNNSRKLEGFLTRNASEDRLSVHLPAWKSHVDEYYATLHDSEHVVQQFSELFCLSDARRYETWFGRTTLGEIAAIGTVSDPESSSKDPLPSPLELTTAPLDILSLFS
jgi:hypothetical protein